MGWAAVGASGTVARSFEFWRPEAPPWVAAGLGELPGSCRFWSLACNVDVMLDTLYTAGATRREVLEEAEKTRRRRRTCKSKLGTAGWRGGVLTGTATLANYANIHVYKRSRNR